MNSAGSPHNVVGGFGPPVRFFGFYDSFGFHLVRFHDIVSVHEVNPKQTRVVVETQSLDEDADEYIVNEDIHTFCLRLDKASRGVNAPPSQSMN